MEVFMKKTLFLPIILLVSGMAQTVLSEDAKKEPFTNMENIPVELYALNNEYKRTLNSLFRGAFREEINEKKGFVALSAVLPHQEYGKAFNRVVMMTKIDTNNQPFSANLIASNDEEAAIIATTFHGDDALQFLQRDHDLNLSKSIWRHFPFIGKFFPYLETDENGKYKPTDSDVRKAYSREELNKRNKELKDEQIELLKETKKMVELEGLTLCENVARVRTGTDKIFKELGIRQCKNRNLANDTDNFLREFHKECAHTE